MTAFLLICVGAFFGVLVGGLNRIRKESDCLSPEEVAMLVDKIHADGVTVGIRMERERAAREAKG